MSVRLLVFTLVCFATTTLRAAPLWEPLQTASPITASLSLPDNAVDLEPGFVPAATLANLEINSSLSVTIGGETLEFRIADQQQFLNGDLGVRAVLDDASGDYLISLTLGADDFFAIIYAPAGRYRIQALNNGDGYEGILYREIRTRDRLPLDGESAAMGSRADALLSGSSNDSGTDQVRATGDVLVDADNDGISNFNESLLGTDPANPNSGPTEGQSVNVDLLLLYTPRYVSEGASGNAVSALNQLVQETNDMYSTSGVGIRFRPALYRQVEYTMPSDLGDALDAVSQRTGVFANVDYLRAISGADLVVLIDGPIPQGGQTCGLANGAGDQTNGDLSEARGDSNTVLYSQTEGCPVDTLAHELGHLFGLAHSRVEANVVGTFPWAVGHGVNGSFHTIMAYDEHYPNAEGLQVFSNPSRNTCKGQPCGVSRTDTTNGADAVFALNTMRFQVGRYSASRPVLSVADATGANTTTTISAGVVRTGGPNGVASAFATNHSSQDQVTLVAQMSVDSSHVGLTGVTHIVIAAQGLGYFQVNSSGGYVPWNGNPGTLLGSSSPRPLKAIEELTAFSNLSFASIGIPSVSLTVFFAYSIQGTSNLIYTTAGVPLVIQ